MFMIIYMMVDLKKKKIWESKQFLKKGLYFHNVHKHSVHKILEKWYLRGYLFLTTYMYLKKREFS